jgi:hypothetical protein
MLGHDNAVINYGIIGWFVMGMKPERKITVYVDRDLLTRAQKATRTGITETVRRGLALLAASEAYDQLLKMRGKVKFSINLNELREGG